VVQFPIEIPPFLARHQHPRIETNVNSVLQRPIAHAVPAGQPQSVAQIAERLFGAYTLEGGRVRLAGCMLEDRLIVRLSGCRDAEALELLVDAEGRDLDPALGQSLGVGSATPIEKCPPAAAAQWNRFLGGGLALVQQRLPPEQDFELQAMTAVWCKFAEGKLRFSFGEASADLPFADWAQTLEAPPWVCPLTGREGFHLAATDDGRITLADQIARCEETGRRTLAQDLVRCEITGKRVLAELAKICPVTGQRVLGRVLVACALCGQQVSPAAIKKERCGACRALRGVGKSDPRMARLLDEHPELDRWQWWRMAETAEVYVLVGSGWVRQILAVADKHTLELKLLATGNRFLPAWDFSQPEQHEHVLRE